jgi:4-diphosphocytidyl-2-C-methyl-D-erythritol kinase
VVQKRTDGFHDLETVYYPLPFHDALELIPTLPENEKKFTKISRNGTDIYFAATGHGIPGNPEDNLIIRACSLMMEHNTFPSFQIHLHKNVPMGAGLGGGSANGAFMLRLLNDTFQLNYTKDKLLSIAKALGSDCPFFLLNYPVIATGRGELMKNIEVDLSGYSLFLIYPNIHIRTIEAFSKIQPLSPKEPLNTQICRPVPEWKNQVSNDFEKTVFSNYPELALLKDLLYQHGAVYASMTGSGSCMYGIFKRGIPPVIALPENCLSWFFPSI